MLARRQRQLWTPLRDWVEEVWEPKGGGEGVLSLCVFAFLLAFLVAALSFGRASAAVIHTAYCVFVW